jgi:hypothetical protein
MSDIKKQKKNIKTIPWEKIMPKKIEIAEDEIADDDIQDIDIVDMATPPPDGSVQISDTLYPMGTYNTISISDPYMKPLLKKYSNGLRTKDPIQLEVTMDDNENETLPNNENDVDIIRQQLIIERIPERMRIIAVVVDNENRANNEINAINCDGEPLGCYAYDAQNDKYYVDCHAYSDFGSISVAYRIKSQGTTESNNIIALPDELIEKYFSPSQKKMGKLLRERYATPRYTIKYMQAVTC